MPAKPPKVVVLGGINIDLFGIAPRMPVAGETVIGERFFTTPGGKGANQAVAAARLGALVHMVGRVGQDAFGPTLLADLRRHGVNVDGVSQDPDHPSGVAIVLLDSKKQNYIVAIYGANSACDESQLKAARKALEGADALMLQLEVPLEVSLAAAKYAVSRGIRVIWDPAPARPMPPDAYAAVSVLTPNQTEVAFHTGVQVTDLTSAQKAARALLERGAPVAVIKLGEQGVYYASADEAAYLPPFKVEVVDTTAAGDAFGAALTVALAEGRSLREAVRYGAAAGALAVTRPGAQEAMPARQEVEALLARR